MGVKGNRKEEKYIQKLEIVEMCSSERPQKTRGRGFSSVLRSFILLVWGQYPTNRLFFFFFLTVYLNNLGEQIRSAIVNVKSRLPKAKVLTPFEGPISF